MVKPAFYYWTGMSLAAGGVMTLLINSGLTPLLRPDASFSETAASSVFLYRQGLSALAAILLLFGSVGLYLRQVEHSGRFAAVAFVIAFLGTALLLAAEWSQVFLVHDLALRAPDTLRLLDSGKGPSLYDIGTMVALSTFSLGWILLAISALRSGVFSRPAPILVIAGFLAIPLLGAVLPGVWGVVVGNGVLASGWFLLGRDMTRWSVRAQSPGSAPPTTKDSSSPRRPGRGSGTGGSHARKRTGPPMALPGRLAGSRGWAERGPAVEPGTPSVGGWRGAGRLCSTPGYERA